MFSSYFWFLHSTLRIVFTTLLQCNFGFQQGILFLFLCLSLNFSLHASSFMKTIDLLVSISLPWLLVQFHSNRIVSIKFYFYFSLGLDHQFYCMDSWHPLTDCTAFYITIPVELHNVWAPIFYIFCHHFPEAKIPLPWVLNEESIWFLLKLSSHLSASSSFYSFCQLGLQAGIPYA